jgi:hypothetical protein
VFGQVQSMLISELPEFSPHCRHPIERSAQSVTR